MSLKPTGGGTELDSVAHAALESLSQDMVARRAFGFVTVEIHYQAGVPYHVRRSISITDKAAGEPWNKLSR